MNNKEKLIKLFLNKSNDHFDKHIKNIEYSLNNSDIEYINFTNPEELFDRLITSYCSNLPDDIRWMSEDDEEYIS